MTTVQLVLLGLFALSFVLFATEHHIGINKSAFAIIFGAVMWIFLAITGAEELEHGLQEAGIEIIEIFMFLFAAMALVELLVEHRFFDWIRHRLLLMGLNDQKQFIVICGLSFVLSAVVDNLTTTIVMVTIASRFFLNRNYVLISAAVVVAANAGGAFSPTGDVTTIMLYTSGKFSEPEIVVQTFLPALVHVLVAGFFLYRQLNPKDTADTPEETVLHMTWRHWVINIAALASFSLPLVMSIVLKLEPYLGLLLGLGIVWLLGSLLNRGNGETVMDIEIEDVMKRVDIPSLIFFTGILLEVAALNQTGVLEQLSSVLLGQSPETGRTAFAVLGMGWLSAVVDNVPLTALMIDMLPAATSTTIWTFLAYAVGVGGSHLVIGSAAGIIAMSLNKELTTPAYIRYATKAVFIAYIAGAAVFWLQQFIFFR